MEDRARVLKDGPWFVGGHYVSIRCWEPNFMATTANLSAVAVWIRLPGLPIEYYEPSVLRDIGLAIGPVLKIDNQTATKARGRFARLCVQVNFDKPTIKLVKIGGIRQPVLYEGINALCFACGRVGHRTEGCPYSARKPELEEMTNVETEAASSPKAGKDHVETDRGDFGPWVLITPKRKPKINPYKEKRRTLTSTKRCWLRAEKKNKKYLLEKVKNILK